MHADILTSAIEIKAQQLHHLLAQFGLFGRREGALGLDQGFVLLAFSHLLDEIGQPALEIAEQGVETGAIHARLVQVEQAVIGAQAGGGGTDLRLFPGQGHDFAEIAEKSLPVVLFALLTPGMFTAGAGQGFGLDQSLGQHGRLLPLATHLAKADLLAGAQRLCGGGSKPVRHLGAGQALMHQDRELSQSGGACWIAAIGHHGGTIPTTDSPQMGEVMELGEALFKFGVAHGVQFLILWAAGLTYSWASVTTCS